MEIVVVERRLSEPRAVSEFTQRERCNAACFELHRVRPVRRYFSKDRTRLICIYEAPDAEAVRQANRTAGLPFDCVWTAEESLAPRGPSAQEG